MTTTNTTHDTLQPNPDTRANQTTNNPTRGIQTEDPDQWKYKRIMFARKTSAIRTKAAPPPQAECWEYLILWEGTDKKTWEHHQTLLPQGRGTHQLRRDLKDAREDRPLHHSYWERSHDPKETPNITPRNDIERWCNGDTATDDEVHRVYKAIKQHITLKQLLEEWEANINIYEPTRHEAEQDRNRDKPYPMPCRTMYLGKPDNNRTMAPTPATDGDDTAIPRKR